MTTVTFYEKPGCKNNTKQKALLIASGHQVEARSLLQHPWTESDLRAFFGDMPVADWFNKAAPKVKSGEVTPETLSATQALTMMITDPLLIRRPLMEANGEKRCGFDPAAIAAWIGLEDADAIPDVETCPNLAKGKPCKHGKTNT